MNTTAQTGAASRWALLLRWAAPPALCLLLFHEGLRIWFFQDDFTHLLLAMFPGYEFWPSLLEPRAQGTFRPLSERLYFYTFYQAFGLNSVPYRVLAFATQIVNLWLLAAVTSRLTMCCWTGFAAAVWALHHSLVVQVKREMALATGHRKVWKT